MKFLLIILFIPILCLAQLQFIPISADYASFSQSDTSAYVEFYLSLFQGNLKYNFHGDTATCSFMTKIEISQDHEVVKESQHKYQNTVTDTSTFRSFNQFVDLFAFELPYGEYKAKIQIQDLSTQLTGEYVLDLELKQPAEDFYFSDIELATKLARDDGTTLFNKNGLVVIPNPRNSFDVLRPVLYFYVELYGLQPGIESDNHYTFGYFVTNSNGDTMKNIPAKEKKILASSQVEAGGFNVISLTQDVYFLSLVATDQVTGKTIERRKKFIVHKPNKKTEVLADTKLPDIDEFYTVKTKEELEAEFQLAKYIADRNEEKIFSNLDSTHAMREFLTTFWRNRDKARHLPMGTTRRNYFELVNYSNQNFGSFQKKGWQSDRGRVLLLYGRPSEVERYPSSIDRLPYVVWHYYELEGGAQFIFCDRDGFGQYELIHSTYRKELSDPNWQRIIYKAATGSGTYNEGF
jgi:GWxTD domain-containing protein